VGFQQLKDPPPSPRSINPQIPEEVERIILKALEKTPTHRYRTVHEMRREFESALPRFATTVTATQTSDKAPVSQEKD
ncbi:MAG: Stk1 family PASTA domain-containing Ser/Thr kinase, partial [Acidobacteriota bacterium]